VRKRSADGHVREAASKDREDQFPVEPRSSKGMKPSGHSMTLQARFGLADVTVRAPFKGSSAQPPAQRGEDRRRTGIPTRPSKSEGNHSTVCAIAAIKTPGSSPSQVRLEALSFPGGPRLSVTCRSPKTSSPEHPSWSDRQLFVRPSSNTVPHRMEKRARGRHVRRHKIRRQDGAGRWRIGWDLV
jgi:hypothetical protein